MSVTIRLTRLIQAGCESCFRTCPGAFKGLWTLKKALADAFQGGGDPNEINLLHSEKITDYQQTYYRIGLDPIPAEVWQKANRCLDKQDCQSLGMFA